MFRVTIVIALLAGLVFAQVDNKKPAQPAKTGTLVLQSGPGSFRAEGEGRLVMDILGGNDPRDAGTVYVSGMKGTLNVQGLRLEYQDRTRSCYHGIGRIELNGKFRAVNFLGSGVKANFVGQGMFRLYGDLDKNGRTGIFAYPDYRDAKGQSVYENWETNGREVLVPRPDTYRPVTPAKPASAAGE